MTQKIVRNATGSAHSNLRLQQIKEVHYGVAMRKIIKYYQQVEKRSLKEVKSLERNRSSEFVEMIATLRRVNPELIDYLNKLHSAHNRIAAATAGIQGMFYLMNGIDSSRYDIHFSDDEWSIDLKTGTLKGHINRTPARALDDQNTMRN